MFLYKDERIHKFEISGRWVDGVKYLFDKWGSEKNNLSVFLKLSINTWYTLTLDGPELFLTGDEREMLCQILCECFYYFKSFFEEDNTCQWMFGYMMEVRADLFLGLGYEYENIEKTGRSLIKKSCRNDSVIAKILEGTYRGSSKNTKENLKNYITEFFDDLWEVEKYFIELLTMNII